MTERALAARGGVLSDGFALLLPPIFEGVFGIKPRGDTREKKKDYSLFGVGLSYSNPYGKRTIIQQNNLVDGVQYL